MSDFNSANRGKEKSFYSLNLTEGRIFIIFVAIVILLVILFFSIFILISKISKSKDRTNNIYLENKTEKDAVDNKNDEDYSFSFYNNLSNEEETTINNNKKEVIEISKPNSDDIKVDVKDNIKTDNINEISNNEPKIEIDNSEVLYSSKYNDNSKFKKETVTIQKKDNSKTIVKNENSTKNSQAVTSSNQIKNKRYVVQVGSYTNKKIADEISLYYSKAGYPTYLQEFSKEGKTYYRLRVGPFREKDKAENYLLSLKQSKYGKSCYISIIYI